ncbi:MAG TPA: methylenetetrahydrofolate--tRNA-(uracil(54)-C(5))-methyltransferase (FADH(2)-oxidizing) TrmFO [Polyangiaceae bacterium]|jgi:methylenetetrahydrofolate--tRNA-(uracil-5-)-methyltransferase|nr:methylenetetrahydrofolate--tRNA-(uracil(54)-C(5))-methyltransferase (FADH(2)-oxidizing) TrmFO [Polyangiaceae bacterium]
MSAGAPAVTIVGAGLAGCEAALGLARRGLRVRLLEQKPGKRTPAQVSDGLCELVCSNSFRGAALSNAVGLLKEEMRRLGSFVMRAADATRVPAGGALAVDRERFSAQMTAWVREHPLISLEQHEVMEIPDARPVIIATGPLTGDGLAADVARRVGGQLAYYDAISPIVSAESIDWERVFVASRYDKGESEEDRNAYVNCPFDEDGYHAFVNEVIAAQKVEPKSFEKVRYFEGCLPIEVMAERGVETLAFGPMKPVGLTDPRTGRRPYAVVQLRAEDEAATAYNIVGFQTRMTWPEQGRVLRTIPGLAQAEFYRYGAVHRNTFINAPALLTPTLSLRSEPGVYFAGQIAGTEGYVESAALGFLAAQFVAAELAGVAPPFPPETTAHGGLLAHLSRPNPDYQPSNITFAHLPPLAAAGARKLKKRARYEALAERALADLDAWIRDGDVVAAE